MSLQENLYENRNSYRQGRTLHLDIHSNDYKIAQLQGNEGTLKAIEDAETKISELTGKEVTLIAYEKEHENSQE